LSTPIIEQNKNLTTPQFAEDVQKGLSNKQKYLPSKYFYDKAGDDLFVEIMNLPEYYLSHAESEIFSREGEALISSLDLTNRPFELYELGAGDGSKTVALLKHLNPTHFTYNPIDISKYAILSLEHKIKQTLPTVKCVGMQGDYFHILEEMKSDMRKVILFLGSNIGNMNDVEANQFFCSLSAVMNPGDKIVLGADLRKDKSIILPAYNDSQGVTRRFNLNILTRINRELGGSFDINTFSHKPEYDEIRGIAYSYLESNQDQEVELKEIGEKFCFKNGEKIHTEISRKYNDEIIAEILRGTGLGIKTFFTDSNHYFKDYIIEKR